MRQSWHETNPGGKVGPLRIGIPTGKYTVTQTVTYTPAVTHLVEYWQSAQSYYAFDHTCIVDAYDSAQYRWDLTCTLPSLGNVGPVAAYVYGSSYEYTAGQRISTDEMPSIKAQTLKRPETVPTGPPRTATRTQKITIRSYNPRCMTWSDSRAIRRGWTKRQVAQRFGTNGHQESVMGSVEERSYPWCEYPDDYFYVWFANGAVYGWNDLGSS
ncbi:MAG: hypothetical protein WCP28_03410 [Actinomycetes bacterium]